MKRKLSIFLSIAIISALSIFFYTNSNKQVGKNTSQQNNTNIKNDSTNINRKENNIDEMSSWKTYENKTLGVKFEYPDNFRIRSEDSISVNFILDVSRENFCSNNPECLIPSLNVQRINEKNIDSYIEKINQKDTRGNDTVIITKSNIVNGQNANWGYTPAMIDSMFVVIEHPQNFIFEINLTGPGVLNFEHSPENKKIIETTPPPWDIDPPTLHFDAYNFNKIIDSIEFL